MGEDEDFGHFITERQVPKRRASQAWSASSLARLFDSGCAFIPNQDISLSTGNVGERTENIPHCPRANVRALRSAAGH